MQAEQFFRSMFRDCWQSYDISKLSDYYDESFNEVIDTVDEHKQPMLIPKGYDYMVKQSIIHKQQFKDTTIDIKRLVANDDNISVHFYSSAVNRKTGNLRHRCVCGIWHCNEKGRIDRVWAVVTPFHIEHQ